jgi:GAF domain-containing protein
VSVTSQQHEDAAEAFTQLARMVYRGASFDEIYGAVCTTAVSVVPGCDHACVTTMSGDGEAVCEAASDEIARLVDKLERETGEGPCLDAITEERFELDSDITESAAWPTLATQVLAATPVRGMMGYRIRVGERKIGALNLLSDTPGAFTADSANVGVMVAALASVALTAAAEQQNAESLRNALDNSREIGKAIGILMATNNLGDEEAFDVLRRASNQLNMRLSAVARRVVTEHGVAGSND